MRKLTLLFSVSILYVATSLAQKVSGVVYFVDEPVKNAKVINEETGQKVVTDENGYFALDAELDAHLSVKYKSSNKETILNGMDSYVDIVLIPSEKSFYKLIKAQPSLKKCELFIANNSNSKYVAEVAKLLEEQTYISAYDMAVESYSLKGLENYLSKYPQGEFVAKASKTIDIISWQKAKSQNTMEAYNAYLLKFPNGEAVSLAKNKVAMLTE